MESGDSNTEREGHEPLTPSGIDARNGFESLSVSTERSFEWVDAKNRFRAHCVR